MSDLEAMNALRCEDVVELGPLYVDGELDGNERAAIDRHAGRCDECAAQLAEQASWKQFIRREAAQPVQAPASLRGKVLAALDEAQARGLGPRPATWRRFVPVMALVGAAAAAVLFLSTASRKAAAPAPRVGAALVADAVKAHERNLPVEVGGDPAHVSRWMQGKVSVPVQPPRLATPTPRGTRALAGAEQASLPLVGGRLSHLYSHEAAQLIYRTSDDQQISMYVFDASTLDDLSGLRTREVNGHTVYVAESRGYRVVLGVSSSGVGYALAVQAQALPEDALVYLLGEALH